MRGFLITHRRKLITLAAAGMVLALLGAAYMHQRLNRPFMTAEKLADIKAEVAAQNEAALVAPSLRGAVSPVSAQTRNVYFGDLHVHSRLSFDSYIFGNRWGLEDAYRFAQGAPLTNPGGEKMQLSRPLDFVAITDHAEGFALPSLCAGAPADKDAAALCAAMNHPTARLFLDLREGGEKRPMQRLQAGPAEVQIKFEDDTWAHIVAMADKHNRPGRFTTFAAYEYSPPLSDSGKHHRNVIFKNGTVPRHAISGFDAAEAPDLWRALRDTCAAPCEVLTIPHNPNKSWGLAFADVTIDGRAYTPEDWALRDAMEPLVEMFQIKGASECALGIGTNDEQCGFEQFFPTCKKGASPGRETLCIHPTAMARDGLKKGLLLDDELGFNPLDFGMIGSTDTHNSNPGDAEEWDYRGAAAAFSTPARTRLTRGRGPRRGIIRNPGGLAAVWAPENTRDAIFEAMQRKEVYATSGTRIGLRFFGGFADLSAALTATDPISELDRMAVPMGSHLRAPAKGGGNAAPQFFISALRDPAAAALDRVQLVKSWVTDGNTQERVIDIICAEGRKPDKNGRCPDLRVAIDLKSCRAEADRGAGSLTTIWQDDDYEIGQKAFYYIRVLEVESCRWSSYDAVRAGLSLSGEGPQGAPQSIAERAWSSPIFVGGKGR